MARQTPYPLFQDFIDYVKERGISFTNLFSVQFQPTPGTRLQTKVLRDFSGNSENLMMMSTDCSFPGTVIPTGQFRINNTPTLKYALGTSYNDISITFYLDSNYTAKRIFDLWENEIYRYKASKQLGNVGDPYAMSVGYKDDYCCNIAITKYERIVTKQTYLSDPLLLTNPRSAKIPTSTSPTARPTGLLSQQKSFITLLYRAFPTNVSSVNLSNSSSGISTITVNFDYESKGTSAFSVQGAGSTQDFINLTDLGYSPNTQQKIPI